MLFGVLSMVWCTFSASYTKSPPERVGFLAGPVGRGSDDASREEREQEKGRTKVSRFIGEAAARRRDLARSRAARGERLQIRPSQSKKKNKPKAFVLLFSDLSETKMKRQSSVKKHRAP